MRVNWDRPQVMLAIELYCRTPFGRIHRTNPEIVELANAIGRTPDAVAMKMSNLAALDTTLPRAGLDRYSKLDEEVWSEFAEKPADFLDKVDSVRATVFSQEFEVQEPKRVQYQGVREGLDVERVVKTRRNQNFFRDMVLSSYGEKCAVTGLKQPQLLIASHIVGWAEDENERLNPSNGLCLNALHDRAFDRKLISFEDDGSLIIFPQLKLNDAVRPLFEGQKLQLPSRFAPSKALMARHRDSCLKVA